jgi:polysaccharide export outer membrane protein
VLTVALIALAVTVSGCVIPRHRAVTPETPPQVTHQLTQAAACSLYRLAPGDVLELLYLTIPSAMGKPYRIGVKDKLEIEFNFHPEMNRTVVVRPDGKIGIPRKDDIKALGLTPDELKRKLVRIYSDIFREPVITVTVTDFNDRNEEFKEAVRSDDHGQARTVTIHPDGHVALPLIPCVQAAGRTVPELTHAVNRRYNRLVRDLRVSVLLKDVAGNLIFVDGEVNKPGSFRITGPTTVQHAIAMAGGTKVTAEPRSVLIIYRAPDGKFMTRITNLANLSSCSDFLVHKNDLVYVPKSMIARADTWVDQNIRKLLVFDGWNLMLDVNVGDGRSD